MLVACFGVWASEQRVFGLGKVVLQLRGIQTHELQSHFLIVGCMYIVAPTKVLVENPRPLPKLTGGHIMATGTTCSMVIMRFVRGLDGLSLAVPGPQK